jgi:hypothetical protein
MPEQSEESPLMAVDGQNEMATILELIYVERKHRRIHESGDIFEKFADLAGRSLREVLESPVNALARADEFQVVENTYYSKIKMIKVKHIFKNKKNNER